MTQFPRRHPLLDGVYDAMEAQSTVPLWEVFDELVTRTPRPSGTAHLWRYADLRPVLLEAGRRISATEAERRVLLLRNPGLRRPTVARTLVAGVQLVLPGEKALPHRHTQAAIRFVLESSGGITTVNGQDWAMEPGDLVLNPSWAWHGHSNPSDSPLIWLDGLDLPLTNFLQATFAEGTGQHSAAGGSAEPPLSPRDDPAEVLPTASVSPDSDPCVQRYPYREAVAALRQRARDEALDPQDGTRLQYTNPQNHGSVLPTMSAFLQYLPAGFRGLVRRSTESTVFSVVEGRGASSIGGTRIEWGPRDVFVVPNWMPHLHEASKDAVLFSFSDRAALSRLGLWYEQRLESRSTSMEAP